MNLGQHRTAVSPGSRAAKSTSYSVSKNSGSSSVGRSSVMLNAPETLTDVGLTLAPEPAVVQPEGQISPGE